MRAYFLLLLGFLLIACNFSSVSVSGLTLPTPIPPPTATDTPVLPTATITPSPTDTITLTETSTDTPTETSTGTPTSLPSATPTPTANLYTYFFPIQPPHLAGFSKGGHPFPATDIFAPLGTKFVAVTSGVVDEVSSVDKWDPAINDPTTAGGLSVRILGDDGFHYYGAHLSSIAYGIRVGIWVPAGQLLGLVGNTGDARFTATHVHFEVSIPNPPFTKLEPFPLLTAWLDGQNVTPALPAP